MSDQPKGQALKDLIEQREEQRRDKAERKAPTTKTEMGKVFKKGGYVRAADGIAQRGKTKGKLV